MVVAGDGGEAGEGGAADEADIGIPRIGAEAPDGIPGACVALAIAAEASSWLNCSGVGSCGVCSRVMGRHRKSGCCVVTYGGAGIGGWYCVWKSVVFGGGAVTVSVVLGGVVGAVGMVIGGVSGAVVKSTTGIRSGMAGIIGLVDFGGFFDW